MPLVLPAALKFPVMYVKFIGCFSFVNLALLPRFLRLECVMRVDHYSSVFCMTLVPLLVAALGLACFVVHVRHTTGTEAKRQLRAAYFGWFLLGTYMIYPSVSTTLFQTQRCEFLAAPEYEGDKSVIAYLRADARLECGYGELSDFNWNPRYNSMWYYAMTFVVVYTIGESRVGSESPSY